MSSKLNLDKLDLQIIQEMLQNAETPYAELGKKLSYLTEDELVTKLFTLWQESITFLNELAPHGYRILNVEFTSKPEISSYRVTFKLMVCLQDAMRINSEWNTDRKCCIQITRIIGWFKVL